ncbi:hypothetical protein PU630_13585 [Microbacterium horticulturae]|uniref:PPE family protein n=1 Tax=Microbacterium horticulturae TaxID=3028316 RepID=A0ABY8BVP6_9MICO|nr:hypothetical protein [Microbacterium sp. KACC 23027]WEG08259.1 hypothetical protein PU630_13585 [Microbacterium sp. KACC 23027]
MTGIWEDRLNNIAYGLTFDMPEAQTVIDKMNDLKDVLLKAAQEPGASGRTGDAATENLKAAAERAKNIAEVTKLVKTKVDQAAEVQYTAQSAWQDLPDGELSAATSTRISMTADEAPVWIPELSMYVVKDAYTLQNARAAVAAKREDAAKTAVEKASDDLDKIEFDENITTKLDGKTSQGGGGGGGTSWPSTSSPQRSFSYYPNAGGSGSGGGSSAGTGSAGSLIGWGSGSLPVNPGTGSDFSGGGPGYPGGSSYPGGTYPGGEYGGDLTPNAPGGGGTTWSGGAPGAGAGAGAGGSAGSGLLGNIATGGAAAGASGAALFGGARLAGGAGGAGGVAAAGGVSGSGGTAGGTLGARGATGVGGAGGSGAVSPGNVGGLGRGGAAGSAGRTGGLLGGTRAGGGAGAASSSAGAGSGARSGMAGAGGHPGAGGRERDKQQGRGLGGPIAPHLEDEEERGPRSASAGAGERG